MDQVFRQYTVQTAEELQHLRETAALIDKDVLEPLTGFLKDYEPRVRSSVNTLTDLMGEYETLHRALEEAKSSYNAVSRMGEFQRIQNLHSLASNLAEDTTFSELSTLDNLCTESRNTSQKDSNILQDTSQMAFMNSQVPISPHDGISEDNSGWRLDAILAKHDIQAPLVLGGGAKFVKNVDFVDFLSSLVSTVPVTKRKLPFPGCSDEIFSSENFSKTVQNFRVYGFNPSRAATEKLGQSLLDMKLLVGTGFFATRFNSDGMWFEWSVAALEIVNFDKVMFSSHEDTPSLIAKAKLDEAFSTMALSTSKTFNGVLKTVTSRLRFRKFSEEVLSDAEFAYNEAYNELLWHKHTLDLHILEQSAQLEVFEKKKISTVVRSLLKLQEIFLLHLQSLNKMSEAFSQKIGQFDISKLENHEFMKIFDNFSSGIFFPTFLSPRSISLGSGAYMNTNFQNIELSFNLYKDISLQVKVIETKHAADSVHKSSPLFLYDVLCLLDKAPVEELQEAWLLPINHQDAWLIKDGIISVAQEFSEIDILNRTDEQSVDAAIVENISKKMGMLQIPRLLNYLKHWLLEVSDSIIPSTVYDSLIKLYNVNEQRKEKSEVVKILGTLPRSNISALLLTISHFSRVFNGYGSFDEIAKEANLMGAVAAVPFVHLIMRPSVLKHASGFKPPLSTYNLILTDLLNPDISATLEKLLTVAEKQFEQRQEHQKKAFDRQLTGARARSTSIHSSENNTSSTDLSYVTPKKASVAQAMQKTPKNLSDGENFSLRPFRTGTTPRPSPSSPVHHSIFREPKLQQFNYST